MCIGGPHPQQGGEAAYDAELLGALSPASALPIALLSLAGCGDGQLAALLESSLCCSTSRSHSELIKGVKVIFGDHLSPSVPMQASEGKCETNPWLTLCPACMCVLGAAGITPCPAHCPQPSHLSLDGKHVGFVAGR